MARVSEKEMKAGSRYEPGGARRGRAKRRASTYAAEEQQMKTAKQQSAAARQILARESEDVDTVKFREGKY